MTISFDTRKDSINLLKHGVSLARADEMDLLAVLADRRRDYGEPRFRAFGLIDGAAYCLAFTYRGSDIRPISLRRAHAKEMKRHVPQSD